MGLWSKIKGIFKPRGSWAVDDDRWYTPFLAPETNAGAKVDQTTALNISGVWACVKIISEDVASLPLHLYQRLPKGKQRAISDSLYTLLHDRPNPEMSAMSFKETLAAHILTWGNAYAEKEMDQLGRVKALWPIPPHLVQVFRDNGTNEIYYQISLEPSGEKKRLSRDQILHIPGLSYNGIVGYSPITKHREALGLALATEEFGARFFGAGTHPGIIVSHPGKLSAEANKNLKESLVTAYSGLGKSHRLMLLEEGMKQEKVGIPPEDAQFLQTRKFQIAEFARIYRIPLHMLNEGDKAATFASVEQFSLEYVTRTLRPWLVRFEQAYNWQLLENDVKRRRYFWEHLVDGLLRGDIKSRYEAYAVGRNWGWLSADDIREIENLNPLPEGKGDIYLQPLNMMEVGMAQEPPEPPAPPEPPIVEPPVKDYWAVRIVDSRFITAFKGLFADALEQILGREAKTIKREAEKANGNLAGILDNVIYGSDFRAYMQKKMLGVIEAFIQSYDETIPQERAIEEAGLFIQGHIEDSKKLLLATEDRDGILETFQDRAGELAEANIAAIMARLRSKNHAYSH